MDACWCLGLNLAAGPGDLIALRGPSGSGKTTILRAIAGLDPFDDGSIDVGDARLEGGRRPDPSMWKRLHRSVGLVFQFHCLFEHMTALQNVCLAPVHVHGTSSREAEAARAGLARPARRRVARVGAAAGVIGRGSATRRYCARAGGESASAADGRADGIARSVTTHRSGRAASASQPIGPDPARDNARRCVREQVRHARADDCRRSDSRGRVRDAAYLGQSPIRFESYAIVIIWPPMSIFSVPVYASVPEYFISPCAVIGGSLQVIVYVAVLPESL